MKSSLLFMIALLATTMLPAGADEEGTLPPLPKPATTSAPANDADPLPSKSQAAKNFENWNLEPSVEKAHLIMVARVTNVSGVTVVEGAKTDKTFREYRFTPVRILKGLFGRDELAMTDADLSLPPGEAALDPHLKEGEYRLLILVQQSGGNPFGGIRSFGCVTAAPGVTTFAQRVPLLAGAEDPLVGVVATLIKVTDSRSRRERAKLLIDQLAKTTGVAVVPLLTSLQSRADLAASGGGLYAPVETWFGGGPAPSLLESIGHRDQPAVRYAAVELIRRMLASHNIPDDPELIDGLAAVLKNALEHYESPTNIRVATIEALGHLLGMKEQSDEIGELLVKSVMGAATHAERAAAVTTLSRLERQEVSAAVGDVLNALPSKVLTQRFLSPDQGLAIVPLALAELPLDAPTERESVYTRAAIRFDRDGAKQALLTRLERSIIARQSLAAEVKALGRLQSEASLPLLLEAAGNLSTSQRDRLDIARALGRIGDDRAVPVLANWLREGNYRLQEAALSSLELIDSKAASQAVRPLLDSESRLVFKLRIARLLARHGIDDGYALATEYLAKQPSWATLVLIALDDPRIAKDLKSLLKASPARQWRAAALTGLAASGDEKAKRKLLEILADDRNPLAAEAARAVGLSADPKLLPPLAELVKSRNKQIAEAALLAIRRYFSGVRDSPRGLAVSLDDGQRLDPAAKVPEKTRAALFEAVSSLVRDPYVDSDLRQQAFTVARMLRGDHYKKLLSELADRAGLEGKKLLAEVQAARRRLRDGDRLPIRPTSP